MKLPRSLISTLIFLGACVSIPGTHKKAFVVVSESEERQMGEQAYAEVLKKERISTNQRWKSILLRVGQRISAQTPVDYDWQYTLIESKEQNAFCLPGGKVAFYTGIFPVLQNEAAMALVMGHEVAHAVARHGAQRMSQGLAVQLGLALGDAWLGGSEKSKTSQIALAAFGLGAQVGILLPFSRAQESEADEMGLKYSAAAGYDPDEGARFWERFSRDHGGKSGSDFLSTHPSDSKRIAKLRSLSGSLHEVYEKSPKYGTGERL